jgi:hypothetical protein
VLPPLFLFAEPMSQGAIAMSCVHLQQLYEFCDREGVKLSSSDLIHIVCRQCNRLEVCPSTLSEHLPEHQEDSTTHETSEGSASDEG